MTIKHLVISGGGPAGFVTYGALKELHMKKTWKLENIKSIYGCSIGAMMGVIISLGYEWTWLDDYLEKRPWHKLIIPTSLSFFEDMIKKKGFVKSSFFEEAIGPLLTAKGLNIKATLLDLYKLTKIDLHVFTTDLNPAAFTKIDLSAKTHPDLLLTKAIAMSCAIPIIFQPICENNSCYIDGGALNNFPLNDCLKKQKCKKEEILAFKNMWCQKHSLVTEQTSIFDFMMILLKRFESSIDTTEHQVNIKNTVRCLIEDLDTFESWSNAFAKEEIRTQLIEKGVNQARLFLSYMDSH